MRPTAVRWRIMWLMVVGSAVAYVLRLNMSIAGEAMIDELSLTPVHFGLILSAFAWGYALFQVPGGLLGERIGSRRALTLIFILWGVVTLATAGLPGAAGATTIVAAAMALRFLMGAAQAPIFPVTSGCTVRSWFPVHEWSMPNALMAVGTTVGGIVAGPFVAWLVLRVGWRGSFLVLAPLAFVGAALWWWYARDEPSRHPHVNAAELELVRSDPPPATDEDAAGWSSVLLKRDVLLLTASYACMNYVFYLFFNWFYFYLTAVRQFPAQTSGWFTGAQWSVGAVAALAGGFMCNRLVRRFGAATGTRALAVAGLMACAGLLVAGAAAPGAIAAVVLLSLSFGCTTLIDVAYWVAATIAGGRHAPAATGLMNTGGNAAGALGAVAVPLAAAAFGWFAAVASGAVFALVAAALWLFVRLSAREVSEAPLVPAA